MSHNLYKHLKTYASLQYFDNPNLLTEMIAKYSQQNNQPTKFSRNLPKSLFLIGKEKVKNPILKKIIKIH